MHSAIHHGPYSNTIHRCCLARPMVHLPALLRPVGRSCDEHRQVCSVLSALWIAHRFLVSASTATICPFHSAYGGRGITSKRRKPDVERTRYIQRRPAVPMSISPNTAQDRLPVCIHVLPHPLHFALHTHTHHTDGNKKIKKAPTPENTKKKNRWALPRMSVCLQTAAADKPAT